jgi:hypothetical protein
MTGGASRKPRPVGGELHYAGKIQSAAGNTLVHMAEGMAKSSEIIVMEMLEFIQREGGHPKTWYVGITDDPQGRLFDEHQVHCQNDALVIDGGIRTGCSARSEYFLDSVWTGEKKGSASGCSCNVYAYRKGISTEP